MRFVYDFDEDPLGATSEDRKRLLGGKGAGLAFMTRSGLPVPPGCIVTTDACSAYLSVGAPAGLEDEVAQALSRLERRTGRALGDADRPLLLSVRFDRAAGHQLRHSRRT